MVALPQTTTPSTPQPFGQQAAGQGTIANLYRTTLGRAPDPMAAGWSGSTVGQVQQGIENSPEFQGKLALSNAPMPDAQSPGFGAWANAQGAPAGQWAGRATAFGAHLADAMNNAPAGGFTPAQLATLNATGNPSGPETAPANPFGVPTPSATPAAPQAFGAQFEAGIAKQPFYQTPQGQQVVADQRLRSQLTGMQRGGSTIAPGQNRPDVNSILSQIYQRYYGGR